MSKGNDIKVTCLECGEEFIITPKEVAWYTVELPKRCYNCRKQRRKNRKEKDNEST